MHYFAAPTIILMLVATGVLLVWTIVDPLRWDREELDPITGESFGRCYSNSRTYFGVALGVVLAIPSVLVSIMAYKCKDIDDAYSESYWIFTLIVVQIEVSIRLSIQF